VTLIVPTYDRANFLPETLDTALGQDYPALEVLVLDDGSTDATPAILEQYADRWQGRLRWSRHGNMGQARTINRGFQMAKGQVIGYLSSDDLLRPHAVRLVVDALLADPQAAVAYPDMALVDEQGREVGRPVFPDHDLLTAVRLHECSVGVGALFWRKVVDSVGGWDPTFRWCADFDFWLRASLVGRFRRVPERLAAWRLHSGMATSASRGEEMAREHVLLIDKLFARENLPDEFRALRAEAYRNAYFAAGIRAGGALNAPGERYIIHDTLAFDPDVKPANNVYQERVRLEAEARRQARELVRLQEEAARAHRAAAELHHECERLRQDVAKRDEAVERLSRRLAEVERTLVVPGWLDLLRRLTPPPLRTSGKRLAQRLFGRRNS
jgi:glycosyltransferase involved in cell wall biosynthesis